MNTKFTDIKNLISGLPLSVKIVSVITLMLFILPYLGVFSSKNARLGILLDYEEPQEQSLTEEHSEPDQNNDVEYEEQNFDIH